MGSLRLRGLKQIAFERSFGSSATFRADGAHFRFYPMNGHRLPRSGVPSDDTKSHRVDQRQVPEFITDVLDCYINVHRPVLCQGNAGQSALWISSTTGRRFTTKNLGTLISKITRETIGVDVSPHLFRTAAASTAAVYAGNIPHLASALLGHRDERVTEEHYNRSMGLSAGDEYGLITQSYRQQKPYG